MAGGYLGASRLLTPCGAPVVGLHWLLFASLMQRLDLSRPIRLLESAAVEVPTVLGIIKPGHPAARHGVNRSLAGSIGRAPGA